MSVALSHGGSSNSADQRGEASLGTLIILIAMMLIAGMTAAVLFDITGVLGSQTEQTSGETASEISDRLEVVTITGSNITESEPDEKRINQVEVVVRNVAGGEPIDLREVTVQWIAEGGFVLNEESTVETGETFSIVKYTDPDDSFPFLTSEDDRFALRFQPGVEFGDVGLAEGQEVQLVILSPSGSQVEVRFSVPRSLLGQDSVELS